MSNRVQKSSSSRQRPNQRESLDSLSAHILKFGFEVMPCTPCFNRKLPCYMTEDVKRCHECVKSRRRCDGSGVPIDSLRRIGEEKDRLDREERLAEDRLVQLQQEMKIKSSQVEEVVAKLLRLRKQQSFLRERGKKMVQRGLQSLEELEAEEEQERQATQAPAAGSSEVAADPGMNIENDWSLNGFNWGAIPADPSGVTDEIFSEGAGRSSSA